ncbi:hypothetical protein IPJ72_01695 [Candidatus Peregrinibacteria bacterium]|nr:MAG: hypothetical protein IPJ72_01695 [Candidatus Peregrinibacteria bacterium]
MIDIELNHSFKAAVGSVNGLEEKKFEKELEEKSGLVKMMFKQRDQEGFDFLNLPDDEKLVRKIERFVKINQQWEAIVVLGIGGSALGTIAIQEAILGPYSQINAKRKLFVIDNIDPDYVEVVLSKISLKKLCSLLFRSQAAQWSPWRSIQW